MALTIKPHTRIFERQWAAPFSIEYQDGGQEPEVWITPVCANIVFVPNQKQAYS